MRRSPLSGTALLLTAVGLAAWPPGETCPGPGAPSRWPVACRLVSSLSVASFNLHGGIDGWGRSFDVVDACRRLDADVLVLQETWTPLGTDHGVGVGPGGDAGDGAGVGEEVAVALGYRITAVTTVPARRFPVPADVGRGWGPSYRRRPGVGLRVDLGSRPSAGRRAGERGSVGIALLERRPGGRPDILELGRMGGDPTRRVALRTGAGPERTAGEVVVVGTHLSHIRQGSPLQLRRLRRLLPSPDVPAVLMGDMNMWGPPLGLMLPGWRRAVTGRTWPSWRPLFQIDHILVTPALRVVGAEVVAVGGSDHLPVRAELVAS